MDHVVYTDAKAKELSLILNGKKKMIIRGAAGRKMPYGRVSEHDQLYLIENDGSGIIQAKTEVISVLNSGEMTKVESVSLVESNQGKLRLTTKQYKRWAGKRYLVLIEIGATERVDAVRIDKSNFGNMDDWLLVEDIEKVIIKP